MKSIINYINESTKFGKHVKDNECPDVFYHATIKNFIPSIKKLGLGAKLPRKRFWDYENTEYENIKQGVFLATDEYVAFDFVDACDEFYDRYEDFDESWIVVFEINKKDLDLSKLYIDTNNNDENSTYFYDGVISFDKLKRIKL